MPVQVNERPHWTHILNLLKDLKDHTIDEILEETVPTISQFTASRYWKNTQEVVTGSTNTHALLGARLMVFRALQEMFDEGWIDVGVIELRPKVNLRSSYRLLPAGQLMLDYSWDTPIEMPRQKDHALNEALSYNPTGSSSTASREVGEPTCAVCDEPIDPSTPGTMSQHLGWRKKRSRGGSNQIVDAGPALAYAHENCYRSPAR